MGMLFWRLNRLREFPRGSISQSRNEIIVNRVSSHHDDAFYCPNIHLVTPL